jgi:FAD/FMN-containing dehydrogenase
MCADISLSAFRDLLGPKGFTADAEDIAPWLTDWRGRYHGKAAAILSPANTAEVAACVALAAKQSIPLVPQGGNTSMVGGATPPQDGRALILSLRRMNAIRSFNVEANQVVCEAGVILATLHAQTETVGRRFPLDLGAKGSATVGGLISTNAGGTQVLRFGTMRGLVEGIEAVLPDGSIYDGLAPLKKDNRGYDLRHLLIGAEGTLGIVTAATLKLVPAMTRASNAWIGLNSPHDALALLRFLEERTGNVIERFEVMADDCVRHVLQHISGTRMPIASAAPWHVLTEADLTALAVDAPDLLEQALGEWIGEGRAIDAAIAQSEGQAAQFWRIRESISEAERAAAAVLAFDISVPIARMPDFMIDAAREIEAHFPGTTASSYGHLGDGNVHFHARSPKSTADRQGWIAQMSGPITRAVHDMVMAAGGSISAEHGIGQMKRAELGRLSSPARLAALRAIKSALDPQGIMNPEKLIPLASEG